MTDKFSLVKASREYADELVSYRRAFINSGDAICGARPLLNFSDIEDWFLFTESLTDEASLPLGYVRSTQLLYIRESDKKLVGTLQVRHTFNDFLREYGGNIGYSVRPDERRKGLAKAMLKDSLDFCRSIGLCRVLITCAVENEGSRRTILSCGGGYESTVYCERDSVFLERYFIELQ